jgi:hypothetical protein
MMQQMTDTFKVNKGSGTKIGLADNGGEHWHQRKAAPLAGVTVGVVFNK